jgi:phosphatidylserine/phosphatidylglycerophosphate/cardiolipin synthase-like enzyme
LLSDGGEFFGRMLDAIEAARNYVLLEMYLVSSGAVTTRFIEALTQAARRGARVCVMFDGFGSQGLARSDRRRLLDAGVELRFFNPLQLKNRFANLLRDHRKLLLADGRVAFVAVRGSATISSPPRPAAAGASSWWKSPAR